MENKIERRHDDPGRSESGSKKPRDFTRFHENKPVTFSDREKYLDEMIGKAHTALKEMHADKQVEYSNFELLDKLLKSCGSSSLSALEKKALFISNKIGEKRQEIVAIDTQISKYKDREGIISDDIRQQNIEIPNMIRQPHIKVAYRIKLELEQIELKLKQLDLHRNKRHPQYNKWILEKEKNIVIKERDLLLATQRFCNHLIKHAENPEQSLQKLGGS